MRDNSLLPLLAPQASNPRRQRIPSWSSLVRFVSRKRIKLYVVLLALVTIIILTIVHKSSLRSHDKPQLNGTHLKDRISSRIHARTMKTIIGKYVGPNPAWLDMTAQNISAEVLNSNNYDPDPNSGQDGRPVYLPGYNKDQMRLLYTVNRFNLVVSDRISVDRKLPDPRKTACRKKIFNNHELPNTSVIIVFHNEAWSTLARTVHSILNTAPQHLLAEILLVDDASERAFLGKPLEYYMNNLGSVRGVDIRVIRSKDRIGLIKSRLLGVGKAIGKVLTFMDAHCEATTGWLEPLLERVKLNPQTAACPIIDIINEETFAFTRSFELHLGAINWGLNFRWYPISRRELIARNSHNYTQGKVRVLELINPFHSPVMAGGLFSIDRDYFNQIGKYDAHMDIWGGENIELSFRIWQCGGKIEIVPCSHVAHIFRKSSPYSFRPGREVGDILYTNLARVAEVWMDEWKQFFYLMNPIVNRTLQKVGRDAALMEIEERKKLRSDLGCKSFGWYLDNVWPENFFPKSDRFFGRISQHNTGNCVQRPTVKIGMGQAAVGAIEITNCTKRLVNSQLFVFDWSTGFLMTDESICLDSGSNPIPTRQVILAPCSESKRQKWSYTDDLFIKHDETGLCLDSPSSNRVQLESCDANRESLKWKLIPETWH